jgi:endonuclease YncB( thermonuclease family)
VLIGGSSSALAPVVDDYRSELRPMSGGCRIDYVIDGDTVDLACPGRGTVRARIIGYDSPELYSPGCPEERAAAERARQALDGLARLRPVEVAFLGTDRYGRDLVDMRLGGQRVATAMVGAGHGRRYLGAARGGWC